MVSESSSIPEDPARRPAADSRSDSPPAGPVEPPTLAPESVPATVAAGCLPLELPADFGRYRLLRQLGQGGMGAVYLAHDTQLDRRVALKVPRYDRAENPSVLERFFREARAAATLQHPNICPIHDVGEVGGVRYLTMAYIEGRPLSEVLRTAGRPLAGRDAAILVRKLARALDEAHRSGVVHRDLKPGNIMLNQRGEPVIMDFGLARRADGSDARLTQQGMMLGTPGYMAPEQARGKPEVVAPACDIYSLGVILYELLTGRLPFEGDAFGMVTRKFREDPPSPRTHRVDLDPTLEAICLKAIARVPSDRYGSMGELAGALTAYLNALGPATADQPTTLDFLPGSPSARPADTAAVAALSPEPPPRTHRRASWRRWAVPTAGAVAVSLVAAVLYGTLRSHPVPHEQTELASNRGDREPPAPSPADRPSGPADPTKVWSAEAVATGKVVAPELDKLEPRHVRDYGKEAPLAREGRGRENGLFYVTGGRWVQWRHENVTNLACEVVGRVTGSGNAWSLGVHGTGDRGGLLILVDDAGRFRIEPPRSPPRPNPQVEVRWTAHPAIRTGSAFNTLLVLVRNRVLEVYINRRAVIRPIALDRDITPADVTLGLVGRGPGLRAEFRRLTVWPEVDAIPPAGARRVLDDREPVRYAWKADELRAGLVPAPALGRGKPPFQDTFQDATSGFPVGTYMDGHHGYESGRYVIHSPHHGFQGWRVPLDRAVPALAGDGLACEVVGQVSGRQGLWGLTFASPRREDRVTVQVGNDGTVRVAHMEVGKVGVIAVAPVRHPAIRPGADTSNTLLAILRGRQLEVYVNSIAVCDPVMLEREIVSPDVTLICGSPLDAAGVVASFSRVTAWPATGVPSLAARGALPATP